MNNKQILTKIQELLNQGYSDGEIIDFLEGYENEIPT